MFVVGTDQVRIVSGRVEPGDVQHAVRLDGAALCRQRSVPYTFPAMAWTLGSTTPESCPMCVEAMTAAAYPPVPAPAYPLDPTLADLAGAEIVEAVEAAELADPLSH